MKLDQIREVVNGFVPTHGIDVVHFAITKLMGELMVFTAAMMAEQELVGIAKSHGLTQQQANDALALMGALQKSGGAHHAWLAAELLKLHTQSMETVVTAFNSIPEKPNATS